MRHAALRSRWENPVGRLLIDEVVSRLLTGRSLNGLDLELHQGRFDLRGMSLPIPSRLARFEAAGWFLEELTETFQFRKVTLAGLDLSGSFLQSLRFYGCHIRDCSLIGAHCQDWRLWDTKVVDCDFGGANLRGSAVGTGTADVLSNSWVNVNFGSSDFRVGACSFARFEGCNFTKAKLESVRFDHCALSRCRFAGTLRNVIFDGRSFDGLPRAELLNEVDFSAARFEGTEFKGYDLSHVQFADDGNLRVLRNARPVERIALSLIADGNSMAERVLRGILENSLKGPGSDSDAHIFSGSDFTDPDIPNFEGFAFGVLDRAAAEFKTASDV